MQAKRIAEASGYIVIAALSIGTAFAEPATQEAPIQVAAVSTPTVAAIREAAAFPAHEAGVRAAAARGPEALRWYVQRTRMIHNFYYNDFARLLGA